MQQFKRSLKTFNLHLEITFDYLAKLIGDNYALESIMMHQYNYYAPRGFQFLKLLVQHFAIKPNLLLHYNTSRNFLPLDANKMQVVILVCQGVHNLPLLLSW